MLSIGDGDTVRVRRNGKAISVRLAWIDACPRDGRAPFWNDHPRLPAAASARRCERWFRSREIGSFTRAQQSLRQGHT